MGIGIRLGALTITWVPLGDAVNAGVMARILVLRDVDLPDVVPDER
jgi:hypothetical protein